ncbi:MAG: YhcH/YjgK/YiaL family protein [Clostridia bacterium]|nr:YhcH/YjgK/YiaL family protein [Clostridia bacterium]
MNDKYAKIKELSAPAYDFVLKMMNEDVAEGRHDLSDGSFVNVMTYETKHRKDCCFEAHKKYIDIQIILDGSEIISTQDVNVMHKYDCIQPFGDGDTELYAINNECVDNVLNAGDFIILCPEDAHMPCVCVGGKKTVRKAVVKVEVKQ